MADQGGPVYSWSHARLDLSSRYPVWELKPSPNGRYLPTGGLEGYRFIGYQLGMGADGLWVHRSAVHMGVVVTSLTIPYNLEWLTELHNLRREASEAQHPGRQQAFSRMTA